ncbi:ParA family protein [Nonomuraea sp. NPDC049695]|uniref:ParA family protein n=1 Tax=Nonomuraea sp. NPDC049695 TaxID=3154734 RepID=UPI003419019D
MTTSEVLEGLVLPPLRRPRYGSHLPPVVSGMNRAGSVGKTTFGLNLCVQAALGGSKVLGIDADLQSDMSYWCGYDGDLIPDGVMTVHDVMLGRATLAEATVPGRTRVAAGDSDGAFAVIEGFDLVRGSKKMSQADSELTMDPAGVFWLQRVLKKQIVEGQYDLIYIDCPASLGRLSVSLLLAAVDVIVAMKPTRKELRGAAALGIAIDEIAAEFEEFGASAQASYYLINEAKSTNSQGAFYMNMQKEAEELFEGRLLPFIGPSVRIPEAYDAQEPVVFWDPSTPLVPIVNKVLTALQFPTKELV